MLAPLLAVVLSAAASAGGFSPSPYLRFDASPAQISQDCDQAIKRAQMDLEEIARLPETSLTFSNTAAALDQAVWTANDRTGSDTFLKEVAVSPAVRQAALQCQTKMDKFNIDVYAREDLFKALSAYAAKKEKSAAEDGRLLDKELEDFRRNGLLLPARKRERVRKIHERIAELQDEFDKNIADDKEGLWLTRTQLAGLPDDYVGGLKRDGDKYWVSVDYPDFFPFMENSKDADARRRLETLFDNRAFQLNEPILKEALALREQAAHLLGYKDHAAYVLEPRMAKNPRTVERFIDDLVRRLKPLGKQDEARLLALKNADDPRSDGKLHIWDWRYYDNQLRKTKYDVDEDKLKEYFPMQTVTEGMLGIYQQVLGVRFKRIADASVWAPDVSLYSVSDAAGGPPIGYFYMDLFPRDGKYKHAASFTLINGRVLPDGTYQKPVSAIVANFAKPSPGRPSLLKHGEHEEIETFFHEFGHIMHQTLTTAKYGRFSGANVALDFVEAPSQMFENWVWQPAVIERISGYYADPSKKLPPNVLQKMIAVKNLDAGIVNLRQMLFAQVDMDYHTRSTVSDPTKIWAKDARKIALMPIAPDTHPEASFGHIMGGYDAGYYGYMWSKVYAQDMFSVFQQDGILNPAVGRRFRDDVLAKGSTEDEMRLVEDFLGRKPNNEAFLRSIGLGAPGGSPSR